MTTFSQFIARHVDAIVDEFADFARTTGPAAARLGLHDLRDHAKIVLNAVAADMERPQTGPEQHEKSLGDAPAPLTSRIKATSQQHAQHRFEQGFTLPEMLSEYRALRASVIRRWTAELAEAGGIANLEQLAQLTRFGEAIDEGLTEAIAWYSGRLEDSRNLLIGVLAHDLRSPLAAVRASANYLLRRDVLQDGDLRAVTRIAASSSRMAGYVNDLLDFTQTLLGAGLTVARASIDLVTLCEDVASELQAAHPNASVEVEARDHPRGHWDAGRLSQLVGNLVANAIVHGEATQPVRVEVSQDGTVARVAVHNAGPAIPAAVMTRLFKPLMQAGGNPGDRHRGSSGLGLGLYIAREIALAHQGSIDVESSDESGTTFTVRLPLR